MPNWTQRREPQKGRRKHATLADIDQSMEPGTPALTACMVCRGHLEYDPAAGEKYCRNPRCAKYVESDACKATREKLHHYEQP